MSEHADTRGGTSIDRSIPSALADLFQEVILDHYRRPRNKGSLETPTHTITMNNPLCGDVIELSISVRGDRIDEVRYEGRGCSISQAAVSMMTERLKGARLGEARALSAKFTRLLHGEEELQRDEKLGDLRALAGVSKFPVRIKCALLGFNCLDELVGEAAAGEHESAAGEHEPEAGEHEPEAGPGERR
jgi:nitrogen fixation NifU-like protein